MSSLAVRIATRFRVLARAFEAADLPSGHLGIGGTLETEKVRVHRYASTLEVTDLTNAGKKGKKVEHVHISPRSGGGLSKELDEIGEVIVELMGKGFKAIQDGIEKYVTEHPGTLNVQVEQKRGIDVEPHGERFEFELTRGGSGGQIRVEVSPHNFHVMDRADMGHFHQDTGYWPRKKQDAIAFYAWMKANVEHAKHFTSMDEFRAVWKGLNISYDFH